MKTIGLIGGMSWESSIEYYRIINQETQHRLGGLHNAVSVMVTIDFAEMEELQHSGRWDEADEVLVKASKSLEASGADFIVICTNTMHRSIPAIEKVVKLPILHIADATAALIKQDGLMRVGLLGTRFTMEEDFYKKRLTDQFGLSVLTPPKTDRDIVHQVIYSELVNGIIRPESRREYLRIIDDLVQAGAQAVILGCTEIGLLVSDQDTQVRLYDTTRIHALAAVEMALD